jgi:F0F1-type ATP synthase epsilon subunit
MNLQMNVQLVGPDSLREFSVEWLEVTTKSGNRVILPGHTPFIEQLMVQKPILMKMPGGALKTIPLEGGVMSVDRTTVLIVLES